MKIFDELLNDVDIFDLFDVGELQDLQDDLSHAAGVASILILPDGTPVTKPSNFTHLCENLIRKSDKGRVNCQYSDRVIGEYSINGPTVQPCLSCGLWDAGAGITVAGKHLGSWLIGQVRNEAQDESVIRSYANEIGIDPDEAAKAFLQVPSMSEERFRNVAHVLFRWTNQLSEMAFHNLKQKALIDELEDSKAEIQKKEENLRITLNSIGEGVITTDGKGCITGINPSACNTLQFSVEELLGVKIEDAIDIINLTTGQKIPNPILEVLKSGEKIKLKEKSVLLSRKGNELIITDSTSPIYDADDNIIGAIFVFRDITAEYKTDEQLLQSQKMESFGQLTGGIAHDFNNILSSILSAATLLKERSINSDSKSNKYIDMILKSSERATQLTKGLLSISKTHSDFEIIILSDLVSEVINVLKFTIDRKVELQFDDSGHDSSIYGNYSSFQSVLMNLGINASQAIDGTGMISISISNKIIDKSYCDTSNFDLLPGNYCCVVVADNGIGISEENISKIFDPFFTTKDRDKGTGLGLSSVKKIVTDHKGEITVDSKLGDGTSFHILIPCAEGDKEVEIKEKKPVVKGNETVLFVDDEDFNRDLGKELLEMSGYNVILAANGSEAVQIYSENYEIIDLVILDIVMPVMDGEETYKNLKKMNNEIKVVPMT